MHPRLGSAAVALLAAVLAGCATTEYSQLTGRRYFFARIDTYPVVVLDVDGRSTASDPVLVDPGTRVVRVQAPPGGAGLQEVRSITLDVPACTRIYLVAVKTNRLASDFQVSVDHREPLSPCVAKAAQRRSCRRACSRKARHPAACRARPSPASATLKRSSGDGGESVGREAGLSLPAHPPRGSSVSPRNSSATDSRSRTSVARSPSTITSAARARLL